MLLKGVVVVDLTQVLAGPFCSMLLGDLGCEVIKVENKNGGDLARRQADERYYFCMLNRNKKSVTLDLKSGADRRIFRDLLKGADVLIENFRPGVMRRLGFHYQSVKEINPKLIYCSISGFGQSGPLAELPAYDLTIQAMSGIMSINGEEGAPPIKACPTLGDFIGAMYAALAIVSALFERRSTGLGRFVDVALFDSTVSWLSYWMGYYLVTGKEFKREGSAHPFIVPYQAFAAKDGYFTLAILDDAHWESLCRAINAGDLAEDQRFRTNKLRWQNKSTLLPILGDTFSTRTVMEWVDLARSLGIPAAPVYTIAQMLNDPLIASRELVEIVRHPSYGDLKLVRFPVRVDGVDFGTRYPPPLLGQHSSELMASARSGGGEGSGRHLTSAG